MRNHPGTTQLTAAEIIASMEQASGGYVRLSDAISWLTNYPSPGKYLGGYFEVVRVINAALDKKYGPRLDEKDCRSDSPDYRMTSGTALVSIKLIRRIALAEDNDALADLVETAAVQKDKRREPKIQFQGSYRPACVAIFHELSALAANKRKSRSTIAVLIRKELIKIQKGDRQNPENWCITGRNGMVPIAETIRREALVSLKAMKLP